MPLAGSATARSTDPPTHRTTATKITTAIVATSRTERLEAGVRSMSWLSAEQWPDSIVQPHHSNGPKEPLQPEFRGPNRRELGMGSRAVLQNLPLQVWLHRVIAWPRPGPDMAPHNADILTATAQQSGSDAQRWVLNRRRIPGASRCFWKWLNPRHRRGVAPKRCWHDADSTD